MKKLVLMFAALALSACVSMQPSVKGARITDTMMDGFKPGKDTQQTIKTQIGDPTRTEGLAGGNQIWRYDFSEVSSTLKITRQTTLFEFNPKGVLTAHYRDGERPWKAASANNQKGASAKKDDGCELSPSGAGYGPTLHASKENCLRAQALFGK